MNCKQAALQNPSFPADNVESFHNKIVRIYIYDSVTPSDQVFHSKCGKFVLASNSVVAQLGSGHMHVLRLKG